MTPENTGPDMLRQIVALLGVFATLLLLSGGGIYAFGTFFGMKPEDAVKKAISSMLWALFFYGVAAVMHLGTIALSS